MWSSIDCLAFQGLSQTVRKFYLPHCCFSGVFLNGLYRTRRYNCRILAQPHQGLACNVFQTYKLVLRLSQMLSDTLGLKPFFIPF